MKQKDPGYGANERCSVIAAPVAFRYKSDIDPEHVPQFGLVAEEVEKKRGYRLRNEKRSGFLSPRRFSAESKWRM